MAEPLKQFFSVELVERLATALVDADPSFAAKRFVARARVRLDELELLDRAQHIADAMAEFLPSSFPQAIEVLIRSLGPENDTDENLGGGMEPFFYLPHVIFVGSRGLEHFEESMRAQYELTKRFSAEFSIRYFLQKDPERTLGVLRTWAEDSNAHVRRLVSEGTRVRLPWAKRVPWLERHPERIIELLDRLKDDPSSMVRRSVANNLNDLTKTTPELAYNTCAEWLEGATSNRRAVVEHALRSAVKRAEPRALKLLGFGSKASVEITNVEIVPARVVIGGRVEIAFVLESTGPKPQPLLVDLAVHFVKARGRATPKFFKLKRVVLAPREKHAFRTNISLAVHTTRTPYPGEHAVDVSINGQQFPLGSFHVVKQKDRAQSANRARLG